ncbi:transmembrane protein 25 isoform X15 [Neopelma chrysocephalum]|uniref:transmembrane protein 25 isoform X15 n=1 Tax=Neopelma chrysocephalum TaxID=114329 RepID=UPI000FCCF789|nr:transmembrane protein 25 isoform X15 [Neopelma chrysocephalum]
MGCTGRCIPHPSRVPLSRAAGPSRRLRAAVPLGGGSGGAQREGWTDLAAAPGPPLRSCTALRAGAQAQSRTADRAGHSSSDAAGLGELGPTIDGQPWTVCTLQEGESRAFTCRVPQPVPGATLAWYLNGQRQEANLSAAGTASTLTLTARRSDHQLNCSLTDPASEETYNASVLLNVQYKPEILRAGAHYQEVEGSGLLLVLFVLVQANPPASITWVDQDGHVMANASEFLLLGATHYPGLANHSLHIHLSSVAGNFSVSAANSVGITTTSLLPTVAPSTHSPRAHACPARPGPCRLTCTSVTSHRRMELPPRMWELVPGEKIVPCQGWRITLSSTSLLPMSGRIYKVPSVSSDEIWL